MILSHIVSGALLTFCFVLFYFELFCSLWVSFWIFYIAKMKEKSDKAGLKLDIQKTKIMAYCPITSWQIDGETVKTVPDFIFLGSKSLQMVIAAMK